MNTSGVADKNFVVRENTQTRVFPLRSMFQCILQCMLKYLTRIDFSLMNER